jgi:hypothetical protein
LNVACILKLFFFNNNLIKLSPMKPLPPIIKIFFFNLYFIIFY